MNRSKSLLRRALGVAGAATLGLAGVVAFAAPASAHNSEVVGVPVCDTASGDWVVTWTVNSIAPAGVKNFRLVEVSHTPADTALEGIAVTEGDGYPLPVGKPITATQKVPAGTTSASLSVRSKWENTYEESKAVTGKVKFRGTCEKDSPKPDFTATSDCSGDVVVTVTNSKKARAAADFEIVGKAGFSEKVTVKPGEDATVTVPAKSAGEIKVLVDGKQLKETVKWTLPENCEVPSLASKSDCDTLTIEVTNPKGGTPLTFTFTPAEGVAKTLDVAPGETKSVVYGGEKAKEVVVSAPDFEPETVAWEKPDNCGGGGGSLAKTGMKISVAVGGALVLLAAGAVLFVIARRRRVTFTA
ncbi:EGFR-like transmembrane domain-containing protein [Rhizomonospora bruguierae]|uniref:EGFR-like transmembrane domain-containing protein n=1 Tax=Rhizomonospora bruguierae TaxID=1581705 RepID=UPI001BCD6917|nr:transmembrane domain-containing protein [Micromonospora sp. NBRC 107566]